MRASSYCVVATDFERIKIDSEGFSGGNRVNESIVLDLRRPAASGQLAAYGIGDPKEHPWLKWLALKAHEQKPARRSGFGLFDQSCEGHFFWAVWHRYGSWCICDAAGRSKKAEGESSKTTQFGLIPPHNNLELTGGGPTGSTSGAAIG